MEVWFKLSCPKCHVANWLCNGDGNITDSSETDTEACICHCCKHSWWLYPEDELHFCTEDAEELADFGLKAPTGYTNI